MSVQRWVVLSDIQIPFEDKQVLWGLVVPFVQELKPHGVVLNGDIVDNYEISDYAKDPKYRLAANLKAEKRGAERLMSALSNVSKERWYLEGNHEDRFRRYAWERLPEFASAGVARTFSEYFELAKWGFKHKPYGGHVMLGKLMVTHGFLVAQHSGVSAKRHFERLGTSVLIGHTHRLGAYYKTNTAGPHGAFENGCLCRLDGLGYAQFPDWQHGFSVVDVFEGGLFSVQQIPVIRRREFMYGGQLVRRAK